MFCLSVPNEASTFVIHDLRVRVKQLLPEGIEPIIVQVELQLQGTVSHAPRVLEQRTGLFDDFREFHGSGSPDRSGEIRAGNEAENNSVDSPSTAVAATPSASGKAGASSPYLECEEPYQEERGRTRILIHSTKSGFPGSRILSLACYVLPYKNNTHHEEGCHADLSR